MKRRTAISDELLRCELELLNLNKYTRNSGIGPKFQMSEPHFLGPLLPPIPFTNHNPDALIGLDYTITIHGKQIHVVCDEKLKLEQRDQSNFEKIFEMKAFKDWCEKLDLELMHGFTKICIESYNVFGSRIGFLKFKTDMKEPRNPGKDLSSITFMRGGSVAIMLYSSVRRTERGTVQ